MKTLWLALLLVSFSSRLETNPPTDPRALYPPPDLKTTEPAPDPPVQIGPMPRIPPGDQSVKPSQTSPSRPKKNVSLSAQEALSRKLEAEFRAKNTAPPPLVTGYPPDTLFGLRLGMDGQAARTAIQFPGRKVASHAQAAWEAWFFGIPGKNEFHLFFLDGRLYRLTFVWEGPLAQCQQAMNNRRTQNGRGEGNDEQVFWRAPTHTYSLKVEARTAETGLLTTDLFLPEKLARARAQGCEIYDLPGLKPVLRTGAAKSGAPVTVTAEEARRELEEWRRRRGGN